MRNASQRVASEHNANNRTLMFLLIPGNRKMTQNNSVPAADAKTIRLSVTVLRRNALVSSRSTQLCTS